MAPQHDGDEMEEDVIEEVTDEEEVEVVSEYPEDAEEMFVEEEILEDFQRAVSQRALTILHEDEEVVIDEFIEEIIEEEVDEDDEELELEGEDADDESSAWIDDGRDYTKNPDLIVPKSFRDQFASEDNGDDGDDGDDAVENQDSFYLNIPDVEEVSSLEDNLSDMSDAEGSQTSISLVVEEVLEEGGESKTKLQPEKPASTTSLIQAFNESADWDTDCLLLFGEEEADDIVSTSSVSQAARGTTAMRRHANKSSLQYMPDKNPLFFGRHVDLERMREALADIDQPEVKNPRRLVWIYGSGGMGKTALAEAFIRADVASPAGENTKKYFVGYGSFDERCLQAQKPYSALVDCLTEIVDQLMHDSIAAGVTTWRDRIKEGLGKEARLLTTLLPNIAQLLEIEDEPIKAANTFDLTTGRLFERMKFVLRRFLRIVCRDQKIVLFLDDIHWADEDSLRMMETMLSTHALKNFFFVGCHRGVKSTHILPLVKTKLANLCAADIVMTPVDQNVAIEIIVNYLKKLAPIAKVRDLDKLSLWITEKSGGNPFHLHQLLRYLVEKGQVEQSDSTWKWNLEGLLDQEIPSSAVDLVVERIQKLSPESNLVIKSAGFMGMRTFRLDLLHHAVRICTLIDKKKEDGVSIESESAIVQHLESAIESELVELLSPGYYGFTHDTARKAAALLLPKSTTKQSFLHSRFAAHLQRDATSMPDDPDAKEEVLLLIADHVSLATEHIKNSNDREKLVRVNLDLAAGAIRKASLSSAVTRIEYGLSVLDHQTKWKDTYELTLKLHLELARVQFCRGNFGSSKIFVDALLANGKSERDKVGAYELLIWLNVARNQLEEAFRVVTLALEKVWGEVLSADVEQEVTKLRALMDGKSDADLLMQPEISNRKTSIKLLFLTRMAELCWMRQDFLNQDLAALKMVELTMRYGSSKYSSLAFVLYGISLARRNLHREAFRFGHLAEMSAAAESPLGAQAITFHHYSISYWRRPFQVSLEPLRKSAEVAIDSNDMEHLSFRVGAYFSHLLATGSRLNTGDALFRRFKEHAIAFRGRTTWLATIPFRLILKLRDQSLEPAERGFESYSDSRAIQYAIFFQMIHAVFMQDMKIAEKLSNKLLLKPEGVWLPMRGFMEGLIATSLARSSSGKIRVKHQRKAAKIIEVLGGWAQKGLKQVYHMANLVNVELRMLSDTKMEPAQSSALYDTAIAAAAKAGFVHHEALANERAGLVYHLQNQEELAKKYLTRAHELYKMWGAEAKVRHIKETFPQIFELPSIAAPKVEYSNELDIFGISEESDSGPNLDFGESQIMNFNFAPALRAPGRGRARAAVRGGRVPIARGRTGQSGPRGGRGLPKLKLPSERSIGRGRGRGRAVGRVPPRLRSGRTGAHAAGRGSTPSTEILPSTTKESTETKEEDKKSVPDGENKKEPRMGGLVKALSWSKRANKQKDPGDDDDVPKADTNKKTAEVVREEPKKSIPSQGLVRSLSWSKRKKTDKKPDEGALEGALSSTGAPAPRRGLVKSFSWSKRKKKSNDAVDGTAADAVKQDAHEAAHDEPKKQPENSSPHDERQDMPSKEPESTGSVLHFSPDTQVGDKSKFSTAGLNLDLWSSSDDESEKSEKKKDKPNTVKDDTSNHSAEDNPQPPASMKSTFSMKSAPGLAADNTNESNEKEKRRKLKVSSSKRDGSGDDDHIALAPRRPRSLASGLDIHSDHGPRRESSKLVRKVVRRKSSESKRKTKDTESSTPPQKPLKDVSEPIGISVATPPAAATKRKSKAKTAAGEESTAKSKERKVRRSISGTEKPEKRKLPSRSRSEAGVLDGSAREGGEKKLKKKSKEKTELKPATEDLEVNGASTAIASKEEAITEDDTQTSTADNPENCSDEKLKKPSSLREGLVKSLSWTGRRKEKTHQGEGDEEAGKSDDGAQHEDSSEKGTKSSSPLRGRLVKSLSWTGKRKKKSKEDSEVTGRDEEEIEEETPRRSKSFNLGSSHGKKVTKLKKGKKKDVASRELDKGEEEEMEEEKPPRRSKSFNMGSSGGKKLSKLRKAKKEDVVASQELDTIKQETKEEEKPRRSKSFNMGSSDGKTLTKLRKTKKEEVVKPPESRTGGDEKAKEDKPTSSEGEKVTKPKKNRKDVVVSGEGGSKKVKKTSKVKRSSKETTEGT